VPLLQEQSAWAVENKNALSSLGFTKEDMQNSVAEKELFPVQIPRASKEPWLVQLGPVISTPPKI